MFRLMRKPALTLPLGLIAGSADAIVGLTLDVPQSVHLMKIATFKINNVARRLPNLLEWLRGAEPDVVCLQELKASTRL